MNENINKISEKLNSIGKKVYIVGGFCREKFLGGDYSGDIDLATDATPNEMEGVLNVAKEVGKKYGTLIILEGGDVFEITTFRSDIGTLNNRKPAEVVFTDSLEKDSKRRDFSFNSIYFDVLSGEFIDPNGGIESIKEKKIEFVGDAEGRLGEDVLRLLRFVRFKFKYNFSHDEALDKVFSKMSILLKNISRERILEEFDKIIALPRFVEALEFMKKIGILKVLLPEVDALSDAPGGGKWHLEGDVWVHTKMTLTELKGLGVEDIELRWAMLLHDIGKSDTISFDKDGFIHYYGHEELGAEQFLAISRRFNFPTKRKNRIKWLIKNHLKLYFLKKMKNYKAYEFVTHKYFEDLIYIWKADQLGRTPVGKENLAEFDRIYPKMKEVFDSVKLYTGKDILEEYPNLAGEKIGVKIKEKNIKLLNSYKFD